MSSTPDLTPHLSGAQTAELEDWGPLPEATGAPMATRGLTVWEEGDSSAGIWECAPGQSYWRLTTHEVIHVVSGRMTVIADGGQPLELGAGDVAVFPRGWAGSWEIHDTLRKVFAVF